MAKLASTQTIAVPVKNEVDDTPRVRIFLPAIEGAESGINVDQYEHVSISNENGDNFVRIKRGEYVDVTPEVFALLKQRYPNL